ncbi:UNVERIFIED_CONTAM: Pggt1b [Trichonephila clavipes]
MPRFHYINPFASYIKSTVAPVVFQRVFASHRSQYSGYSAIYTDGSKHADYIGCGVVIEDIMHGYRLDTSCSVFTAEAVAIYRALQLIDSNMPRKYCIYTDSMNVLEALENYNNRCHPVVCNILDITSQLYSKGFDIVLGWLPSHVRIIGNEQADSAARSATILLPLAVPLSDMKHVILHHIFRIWQESCSGSTFCALATLYLMGRIEETFTERELKDLKRWLIFRQTSGFNGRPNKPEDSCYTFWIGASLKILGGYNFVNYPKVSKFVFHNQDCICGGIAKLAKLTPDILHTCLGISGLLLYDKGKSLVHPGLNISQRAANYLSKLHNQWKLQS